MAGGLAGAAAGRGAGTLGVADAGVGAGVTASPAGGGCVAEQPSTSSDATTALARPCSTQVRLARPDLLS
ncbi:hypothetical protein WME99_32300 [Sorangium sp. So ce136]|uniref:hypothetical protein n=1 Tax=Sorangium sp. So ce136 TaxID=3133284 RepID=UPI003F1233C6